MRDSLSAESNFNRIMIAGGRAPESGLPASKSVHGQASGPGLIITSQPESDSGPEVHLFFLAPRGCSSQPSGADWAVLVINHEFSSVCASASLDVERVSGVTACTGNSVHLHPTSNSALALCAIALLPKRTKKWLSYSRCCAHYSMSHNPLNAPVATHLYEPISFIAHVISPCLLNAYL